MEAKQCLLLADDDLDDCNFFQEALDGLQLPATLVTVHDGEQLMDYLLMTSDNLPQVLFLDLNMPRKSGFECLSEIRDQAKYKDLPVVILSTSQDSVVEDRLFSQGAHYYIRKPGDFSDLKKSIFKAISILLESNFKQPNRDQFVIIA